MRHVQSIQRASGHYANYRKCQRILLKGERIGHHGLLFLQVQDLLKRGHCILALRDLHYAFWFRQFRGSEIFGVIEAKLSIHTMATMQYCL